MGGLSYIGAPCRRPHCAICTPNAYTKYELKTPGHVRFCTRRRRRSLPFSFSCSERHPPQWRPPSPAAAPAPVLHAQLRGLLPSWTPLLPPAARPPPRAAPAWRTRPVGPAARCVPWYEAPRPPHCRGRGGSALCHARGQAAHHSGAAADGCAEANRMWLHTDASK